MSGQLHLSSAILLNPDYPLRAFCQSAYGALHLFTRANLLRTCASSSSHTTPNPMPKSNSHTTQASSEAFVTTSRFMATGMIRCSASGPRQLWDGAATCTRFVRAPTTCHHCSPTASPHHLLTPPLASLEYTHNRPHFFNPSRVDPPASPLPSTIRAQAMLQSALAP